MNPTHSSHKVVIIGDSMVGKTSIVQYLVKGLITSHYAPTIGTGILNWVYSNGKNKVELLIWDTAGQEQYRSMGEFFYRNSEAAILVFSQDVPFEKQHPDNWLQSFQRVAGTTPFIVIAGNKSDITTENSKTIAEWAKSHNFDYIETSARNGMGIQAIFHLIAMNVSKSRSLFSNFKEKSKELTEECSSKVQSCC